MRRLLPSGLYSEFRKQLTHGRSKFLISAVSVPLLTGGIANFPAATAADSEVKASSSAHLSKVSTTSGNNSKQNKGIIAKGLIAHVSPAYDDGAGQEKRKSISSADFTNKSDQSEKASKDEKSDKSDSIKTDNEYARAYFQQERTARKRKYANSSSTVEIYAPQAIVWKVLIDFEHYPEIFKRIDTCHITKREHGLLFAETYLKPQMFVKKLCQHTVTDISQGPNFLQWKMLDGNFTSVLGSWTLSTTQDKKGNPVCSATYTLEADPGPVIPKPMVSFLLHQIEHEVVSSFKKACEKTYAASPEHN